MSQQDKLRYLFRNLFRGLLWLLVIVIAFVLVNHTTDFQSSELLQKLGDRPYLVYFIYIISEMIIGIIPPEMFMVWSLELASNRIYLMDLTLLAMLSYTAGVITYYFGRYFNQTVIYRYVRKRYLRKFEPRVHEFGGFLLFVAALTPVPYSGVCMLMGSVNYSYRKFFLITLFRFLRFALYGYIMYRASLL